MSNTVCIAAICVDRVTKRHFAILCSDTRIEVEGIGKGEIKGGKVIQQFAPGMVAMFAGDVAKAKELTDRYKRILNVPDMVLDPAKAVQILSEPLREQYIADATTYLALKRGIEYETFLSHSIEDREALLYGLDQWKYSCELIIVWMGPGFVRLFRVNSAISEALNFTIIGIGDQAANSALLARGFATYHRLEEAIYYLYEAKRLSESIPGIGPETHMSVLEFNAGSRGHTYHDLTRRELAILSEQFELLGRPRPFSTLMADKMLNLSFNSRLR